LEQYECWKGELSPAIPNLTLAGGHGLAISSPSSNPSDLVALAPEEKDSPAAADSHIPPSCIFRLHVPTYINIRSISSCIQAKALVQLALHQWMFEAHHVRGETSSHAREAVEVGRKTTGLVEDGIVDVVGCVGQSDCIYERLGPFLRPVLLYHTIR
jgi:hypothetical protein